MSAQRWWVEATAEPRSSSCRCVLVGLQDGHYRLVLAGHRTTQRCSSCHAAVCRLDRHIILHRQQGPSPQESQPRGRPGLMAITWTRTTVHRPPAAHRMRSTKSRPPRRLPCPQTARPRHRPGGYGLPVGSPVQQSRLGLSDSLQQHQHDRRRGRSFEANRPSTAGNETFICQNTCSLPPKPRLG